GREYRPFHPGQVQRGDLLRGENAVVLLRTGAIALIRSGQRQAREEKRVVAHRRRRFTARIGSRDALGTIESRRATSFEEESVRGEMEHAAAGSHLLEHRFGSGASRE